MKALRSALIVAMSLGCSPAFPQASQLRQGSYALKSGESVEISDLYYVVLCRSILTGSPQVTILDGPPGVTASVAEASVVPRAQGCPRPVKGAKLTLKAGEIEDQSSSLMTLRVKYPTKDGDRDVSMTVGIALFP